MSKADFKHLIFGLVIFLVVWWLGNLVSLNGIWFGMLAVTMVASFKELNDNFGYFQFILDWLGNGEKTGFSGRDWWMGVLIPLIITILIYTNVINL